MERTHRLMAVTLIWALLLATASLGWSQTGTWTRLADMPTARFGLATAVVDGKIYAIGGMADRGLSTHLSAAEVYDPATDTWTQIADMPTPRAFLQAQVVDGVIYAIGGRVNDPEGDDDPFPGGGTPVATVEAYDPALGRWVALADMPTARSHFPAAAIDGRIHVAFGYQWTWGRGNPSTAVFEPATDRWTVQTTDTGRPHSAHSAACALDGVIYLLGGAECPQELNYIWALSRVAEVYDPMAGVLSEVTTALIPRTALSATEVGGWICALGGSKDERAASRWVPTVDAWNPTTGRCVRLPDLPEAKGHLAASTVDGTIYAIGGVALRFGPGVASVYAFTPGDWSTSVESSSWGSIKARTVPQQP